MKTIKQDFCHICIIRKQNTEAICYQLWLANEPNFYHIEFLACFASLEGSEKKDTEVMGKIWALNRQLNA